VADITILTKIRKLAGFTAYCAPVVKALDGDRDAAVVLMWLLFHHERGCPPLTADYAEGQLAMPRSTFFRAVKRLRARGLIHYSRKRHGNAYRVDVALLCGLLGIDHEMVQPEPSEMNHPEPSQPQMGQPEPSQPKMVQPEPSEMVQSDTPDGSTWSISKTILNHLDGETPRTDTETQTPRCSLDIVDIPPNPPGGTDALTGGEQPKVGWLEIRDDWVHEWERREGESKRKHKREDQGFFGLRGPFAGQRKLDNLVQRGPAEAVQKALRRSRRLWVSSGRGGTPRKAGRNTRAGVGIRRR
jgi:hypothetical protein